VRERDSELEELRGQWFALKNVERELMNEIMTLKREHARVESKIKSLKSELESTRIAGKSVDRSRFTSVQVQPEEFSGPKTPNAKETKLDSLVQSKLNLQSEELTSLSRKLENLQLESQEKNDAYESIVLQLKNEYDSVNYECKTVKRDFEELKLKFDGKLDELAKKNFEHEK
jgi:hypothetical protein